MVIFNEDMRVSQEIILKAREDRGVKIDKLREEYPGESIVSFKLNIPGDIKMGPQIVCLFNFGFNAAQRLITKMAPTTLVEREYEDYGPEGIIVSNVDAQTIKKAMIELEDGSEEGRLYDIDVYIDGKQISRTDLGLLKRKCLICDKDAVECSRNETHDIEALREAASKIIEKTVC